MFKYYIKVIIRNLLKIFWFFPIDKKKIYFQSFGGNSMNCNPWYIFKYMYEKYPDYKYVWLLNKEPEVILKGVTYVQKRTLKWIKEILTSKVLITNDTLSNLPYRKDNVIINTWHGGGAYKKVGKENKEDVLNKIDINYISEKTTFFISSSRMFTAVMAFTQQINSERFIATGMPRNDMFFSQDIVLYNSKEIRNKYGFTSNDFLVMYAPTYRGISGKAYFKDTLDIAKIKETITITTQKNVKIMFRGHYYGIDDAEMYSRYDVIASDYPDMQKLLCATDMLITDYSSSIWDYSFLYRPCFLFAPDFEQYKTTRGFYTDPNTWGFPICKSNDELADAIASYNYESFAAAMKKHQTDLGSYENGTATEQIVKLIDNTIIQ